MHYSMAITDCLENYIAGAICQLIINVENRTFRKFKVSIRL